MTTITQTLMSNQPPSPTAHLLHTPDIRLHQGAAQPDRRQPTTGQARPGGLKCHPPRNLTAHRKAQRRIAIKRLACRLSLTMRRLHLSRATVLPRQTTAHQGRTTEGPVKDMVLLPSRITEHLWEIIPVRGQDSSSTIDTADRAHPRRATTKLPPMTSIPTSISPLTPMTTALLI